jgi:hypothetical protein
MSRLTPLGSGVGRALGCNPGGILASVLAWVLGGILVAAPGCTGGPVSRPVARDQVASELCAHAARCDDIGPGGRAFASLDACLSLQSSAVEDRWLPDPCVTIETQALDACLTALRATDCAVGDATGAPWLEACGANHVCGP